MDLHTLEQLTLSGRCTLRAWRRGALEYQMAKGMTLPMAQDVCELMGDLVDENTVDNLIVAIGKQLVGDLMIGAETVGLTYFALGTGTTAPALTDATLTTEVTRAQISSRSRSSNIVDLTTFFTAAQSTYNIQEVGVFGGASAGATAGSGRLFNHVLQAYDNSGGLVDLTFDVQITVG